MEQRTAEILCIGTEILMGDIVNTNAAVIAKERAGAGINRYHQTVVGDNPGRLEEALELAFSRSDIVITTGGLGPTYDDLTKEVISGWFGLPLELDQESLESIEASFRRRNRPMTENNRKQAMLPKGSTIFHNPNGSAPGCAIEGKGKTAIMLPGPPREMEPMLKDQVMPFLRKDSGVRLVSRNLHFFGIGESALEQELHQLMTESKNPTVAPYAKTGEVMLRVTARVEKDQDPESLLGPAVQEIQETAGEYLYGVDVGDLQTALVRELRARGLTIAAAESCTGGYVAKRITDVAGSSAVFRCSLVAYTRETKEKLLGVSPDTLDRYTAVSAETAAEMAAGARKISGADLAVAVTGNAGPEPSEGKAVGEVYVAVDSSWHSEVLPLNIRRVDQDSRELVRYMAASHALDLALKTARKPQAAADE